MAVFKERPRKKAELDKGGEGMKKKSRKSGMRSLRA